MALLVFSIFGILILCNTSYNILSVLWIVFGWLPQTKHAGTKCRWAISINHDQNKPHSDQMWDHHNVLHFAADAITKGAFWVVHRGKSKYFCAYRKKRNIWGQSLLPGIIKDSLLLYTSFILGGELQVGHEICFGQWAMRVDGMGHFWVRDVPAIMRFCYVIFPYGMCLGNHRGCFLKWVQE